MKNFFKKLTNSLETSEERISVVGNKSTGIIQTETQRGSRRRRRRRVRSKRKVKGRRREGREQLWDKVLTHL